MREAGRGGISGRPPRSRDIRFGVAALALLAGIGAGSAAPVRAAAEPTEQHAANVLVFSRTTGFRHDSIPAGLAAIRELGAQNGFTVETTEDPAVFTDVGLAEYDAVVWLSTTGDVLNGTQQAAFRRYIEGGGGYAGVHAASDTEYNWPWYGSLVGAYFKSHPHIQRATVEVEDREHPSTSGLPQQWPRTDEWYNYRSNPRANVRVLATLDESSYQPGDGAMGEDHPIAWCHENNGGRAWYTGGGHTIQSYSEPEFRSHLLGGILYAAGKREADCHRPDSTRPPTDSGSDGLAAPSKVDTTGSTTDKTTDNTG